MKAITYAFLLGLACGTQPGCSRREDKTDEGPVLVANPRYKRWADFKPGSYCVLRHNLSIAKKVALMYQRATLLEVSDTQVVIKTRESERLTFDGKDIISRTEVIPAMIPESQVYGDEPGPVVKHGVETIRLPGETLQTRWEESGGSLGVGASMVSRVWYCERIPGQVVRHNHTTTMPAGKMISIKMLVKYHIAE